MPGICVRLRVKVTCHIVSDFSFIFDQFVVLQALNPLPSAAAVANCIAWLAYGFVIRNWYIWVENFLGLVAGLVLFLASFGIGVDSVRQRDTLTFVGLVFAVLLPIIGALERLVFTDDGGAQKKLWGYTCATPMASC